MTSSVTSDPVFLAFRHLQFQAARDHQHSQINSPETPESMLMTEADQDAMSVIFQPCGFHLCPWYSLQTYAKCQTLRLHSAAVVFTRHFPARRRLILSKESLPNVFWILPLQCWVQKNNSICAVHLLGQRMEEWVRKSRQFSSDLYHIGLNLIKICLVNYSALIRDGMTHFSSINSPDPFCVQTAVWTPSAVFLMSITHCLKWSINTLSSTFCCVRCWIKQFLVIFFNM